MSTGRWIAGAGLLGIAVLLAAAGASARAQAPSTASAAPQWFTVTGNDTQPGTETVQVDLAALQSDGSARTLGLRINRARQRSNWDDVPYRSYTAVVRVDCRTGRAHYLEARFFLEPLWQGESHQRSDYRNDPKPMLFKGMEPNPTERIVRAACRPGS